MCRQERASLRQKRYRYAFRKALVHAASSNPDCAGKLLQELRGASRGSSRLGSLRPGFLILIVCFETYGRRDVLSGVCSATPARQQNTDSETCTGSTKGQACSSKALPFTEHCFQRILFTTYWLLSADQ